jgi:hypothetical protein
METRSKSLISKWWIKLPLLALLVFGAAQCGNSNGLSSGVTIDFEPQTPIVVLTTLTVNYIDGTGTEQTATFTAPWYETELKISNNSEAYLTITSFLFTATYQSNGSITTKANNTFDISSLDPRFACNAASGVTRSEIVTGMDPGQVYTTLKDPCDSGDTSITTTNTATPPVPTSDIYYVNSLPTADNTDYFIEFYAQGWFENGPEGQGVPIARLINTAFQSTQ